VTFLLLAAGQSRRMQADKALLDYHGEPWIRRQVKEIHSSGVVDQIVIVDQPANKADFQKCLTDFSNIHFVENPVANSAPSDSIHLAFRFREFPKGVLISPIDVPLKAQVIAALSNQKRNSAWVVKPRFQGCGGHPVWLSPEAVINFRENPRRLDHWIRSLAPEKMQSVEVDDDLIRLNLNTPEDWQLFLNPERAHSKS
jgi:CTP:molybdopterin cytidylyltransferase MocA